MKLSVMLYSLSTVINSGQMSVAEVCKFLRHQCHIDAIEPFHSHVSSLGIEAFKSLLEELNQHVCCYIADVNFVEQAIEGNAIREAHAAVDACVRVGCKTMLLDGGNCRSGISKAEARHHIANGLKDVIRYARPQGVTITIEETGYPASAHGTINEMHEMLGLTGPDLMLTYDNGNFYTQGDDPIEAFEKLRHRVVHVHLKDWRRLDHQESTQQYCRGTDNARYQGEICGQGLLNLQASIDALRRCMYSGYLSLEYEGRGDPLDAVALSLANVRALL